MTVTVTPLETTATADEALRHYARHDPGRVALSVDGEQISYAELDATVDAMAARLLADLGRRPAFVAVRLQGTVSMVTTGLAVTRAGMTYVPIDPTAPPDRVAAVLREVEPGILFSDVETDAQETWPVPLADPGTYRADPPAGGVNESAAELSAVVFTSGSTGTPKGIMHSRTHRESMARMIREMSLRYPQPEAFRIGAITVGTVGLADGAAHATLVLGGTFIGYDIRRLGLEPWGEWMRQERITTTALVPTIWRFFAGTLDSSVRFPDLGVLVMVGEASTWDDIALLRRHISDEAYVINMLAQTEVGISRFEVTPDMPLGTGRLPAGVPMPGRDLNILDPDGNPVPAGERGEIVVDTFDCAAGYWKLPEATARTFEPLPDGRTRVHTGDAGRLLPDGSLEHLGRLDHMVKVSGGNRVELGDVEAGLRGLTGVVGAAAVAVPGSDGDLRLMAAVVLDGSLLEAPTGLELREQLGHALPTPMLPDRIYVVDELPTLPGGKVDRRGLVDDILQGRLGPAVDAGGEDAPDGRLAMIMDLYADVLDRSDVGPDSDFFDFGGDSLRAARLMARLGELVGRNLPVSLLLEDPTPRGLAPLLAACSGDDPLVVLRRGRLDGSTLVLIHDGTADVFYARHLLAALDQDQTVVGLRAETLGGHPPQDKDLPSVGERYVAALRRSGFTGPWLVYGFSLGGTVGFEVACQLQAAGDDVRLLAVGDSPGPIPSEMSGASSYLRLRLSNRLQQLRAMSPGRAVHHGAWLAGRQARHLGRVGLAAVQRWSGVRPPSPRQQLDAALATGDAVPSDLVYELTVESFGPMLLAYQPVRRFNGDLLVFRAQSFDDRPDNGWGPHITGDVEVLALDTAHDLIHQGAAADQLADRLCAAVRQAQLPA